MSTSNFIVVLKQDATPEQVQQYADQVKETGGEVGHVYNSALKGFSAKLTDNGLQRFQSLQDEGIIDYIEPDGIVTTQ